MRTCLGKVAAFSADVAFPPHPGPLPWGEGESLPALGRSRSRGEFEKNAATFTVVRDAAQKLVDKVGIATMPSSFLIDREGKVRFMHSGYRGEETKKKYAEEIESLLKK